MTAPGSSQVEVRKGQWAGWKMWTGEPFEELAGPFYSCTDAHGPVCAIRIERRHMNGLATAHGGLLAAFADSAIFSLSEDAWIQYGGVTASLNLQYMGAVRLGDLVEARPQSVKATGEFVFVNGIARVKDEPVLGFGGIIKKWRARS